DDPSDQQPREDPSPAPRPDRCRPDGAVGARSGPFLIRAVGVRAGQPASIADATPKSPPTNSSQSSLADDIPLPLVAFSHAVQRSTNSPSMPASTCHLPEAQFDPSIAASFPS